MTSEGTLLQNGRYRISKALGGGGMGKVYLVEDTRLAGRYCAIKEMSPADIPAQDRNWAIQAFRQEAQMLANLKHPGLTNVTDFFPEQGKWYLVMEYVHGETLQEFVERSRGHRFPIEQALNIVFQLCDVLTYLHEQNPPVIFRDLKPGNVMITPQGEVKLIDFGIARFFKQGRARDTINLGTPGYAAPEQYGGMGQSDPRTDIYSLGALLLELITGFNPAMAATPFPLPDPQSLWAGVPSHIADAIRKATQLQPELRFWTVAQMRQALLTPAQSPQGMGQTWAIPPGGMAPTVVGQPISSPLPGGWPGGNDRSQTQTTRRKWFWIGGAIVGLVLLVSCAVIAFRFPEILAAITGEATTAAPPVQDLTTEAPTSVEEPPILTEAPHTPEEPLPTDPSQTEPPVTEPPTTQPPTTEPSPTPPPARVTWYSIGRSVQGRDLSMLCAGYEGGAAVVVIGSIQGDQAPTLNLANSLASYFQGHLTEIPQDMAFYVIGSINPDGNANNSRYNAHDVDLNRNWDTRDWRSNAAVPGYPSGKAGAGGSSPFSEPETRALRDFLYDIASSARELRIVILHSSVNRTKGEIYPGGNSALQLARTYAGITGYDIEESWAEYVTSGEAVTWCEEQGMPALDIVIPASQSPSTRVSGSRTLLDITVQALYEIAQ
ncbi:MAG: protein kinase [Anaerolineae bacterium]|nr:protein kinase [Anaerolineae bacterium]